MTTYMVLGVAALVAGLLIGHTAIVKARRGANGPEQATRRVRTVRYYFLALGAALLILDAIDYPERRYFDLAVVAVMVGGVAFDWVHARRKRQHT